MAGPSRFTVVLDACVLYPAVVRDALMSLHSARFFAAKWTRTIEQEWTTNLLKNRADLTQDQLAATCRLMRQAAPDWEVINYEPLIKALELPDENDRHVLAAAIRGHADCIVSFNTDDFPKDYLAGFDVELLHPDDFITLQLELRPVDALKVFKAWRERLRKPAMSREAFVENIAQAGLARTAAKLREDIELL
jgi:predicted nucleic acid-binding protein